MEEIGSFVGALRKMWSARDDERKIAFVQESDFKDKILPAIGVWAIAVTVIALHVYESDRLGFFANLWSSFVAVIVSCLALAVYLAIEHLWRNKYVHYILERRWKLTWLKVIAPYLLVVVVMAVCIIIYKVTY